MWLTGALVSEPRRSVRSTKGVNNRLSDIGLESASPTPNSGQITKSKKKAAAKDKDRSSPARSQTTEDANSNGSDDIIRCVCGAKEEDEDDSRMMIQCEGCDAWQHTQCMGIPKKKIPKQYFCEICRPENHQVLLEQLEKGEKPWEKKPTAKRKGKKDLTPARGQKQGSAPARGMRKEQTPTRAKSEVTPVPEPQDIPISKPETPVAKKPSPRRRKSVVDKKGSAPPVELGDRMDIDEPQLVPEDIPDKPPEPDDIIDRERTVSMELSPAKQYSERNGNGILGEVAGDSPEPQVEPRKSSSAPVTDDKYQTPISIPKDEFVGGGTRRDSVRSAKSMKRRPTDDSDGEYKQDEDVCFQEFCIFAAVAKISQEPQKKIRRVSTFGNDASPKEAKPLGRRSSVAKPPVKRQKMEDNTPQKELVASIDELRNEGRRNIANLLKERLTDRASSLVAENELVLPEDQAINQFCEKLALQVEHQVYLLFFNEGELSSDYSKKVRSIAYNLRANLSLSDELLKGGLEPERLAHMTSDEMASKELKELMQKVRLESEKHNTLITETGPRIRRTHKGEELVGEVKEEEDTTAQDDSLLTPSSFPRRSDSTDDPPASATKSPSAAVEVVESPVTVPENHYDEPPRSPSALNNRLPLTDTKDAEKGRQFSIENVWNHIEAPDPDHIPRPMRPTQAPATGRETDLKIDKDIDMLLKDDDGDATPPYSPASAVSDDHYSPRHEEEEEEWRGRVEMNGIASLSATAALVGGSEYVANTKWSELLADALQIDGRIKHDRATEYLCGQKFSKSSSLVMVSLTPTDGVAETEFKKLFDYFKERDRYAVVGKHFLKCIKDLYIVPVDVQDSLPDWFNVLDPPSRIPETGRQGKLLIVIFVVIRNLVGLPAAAPTPVTTDVSSYTQLHHRSSDPPYASPILPTPPGAHHQGLPYSSPQHLQQHSFVYSNVNAPSHQQQSQYNMSYPNGAYTANSSAHIGAIPPPLPPQPMSSGISGQLPGNVPLAEMTQNLLQLFPDMDSNQLMLINNILIENPNIHNDPDALMKLIARQMSGV